MKTLKVIVGCFAMLFFATSSIGQRVSAPVNQTARATKTIPVVRPSYKKMGHGKKIPYIANYKLRNGKSHAYIKSTKFELSKSRGRVLSVKRVSRGRVGSNILKSPVNNLVICTGEDDCIKTMSDCDSSIKFCIEDIPGHPICFCF